MKTALSIIALALTVSPAVASAKPVVVRYADLDLSTARGAAKLEDRIAYAAQAACIAGSRGSEAMRYEAACRTDIVERARVAARIAIARANAHKARLASSADMPAVQPHA